MAGALFETFVAQNLLGIVEGSILAGTLHFWWVQNRPEVDFVLEEGRTCLAIEVKSATRWGDGDLSGHRAFFQATPHALGAILAYNGSEAVSLGHQLWDLAVSHLIA